MQEHEIIAGLRRGEEAAFDGAYARYRARLFGFIVRLCADRARAEDLLQETWLRLARHARALRPETNLGAWLFTVARNLCTSELRARALHRTRLVDPSLTQGGHRRIDTPLEQVVADETQRHVERALSELPPQAREMLLLCSVEQFAPQEAAAILGISDEAARQRLARARAALAAALVEGEARAKLASIGGQR